MNWYSEANKVQNIRLTIAYEGTNYSGWQVQKRQKSKTIQGVLEKALATITRERIRIVGAGRTDAGVHALGQVANFKTRSKMSPEEFKKALNSMLPKDIVIKNVQRAREDFHAQFDAKSKCYRYIIYQGSTHSPFLKNYTCYILSKLNLKAMREGAKYLLGKYNFSSFQLSGSSVRSPVRTITKLTIVPYRNYCLLFTGGTPTDVGVGLLKNGSAIFVNIEADGFLYGMVRSIVGTLIEVGRGKISPLKVKEILKAGNRRLAGPTASAQGLYLAKIEY